MLEHGHIITLTHLGAGAVQFACACGEGQVGPERMIRALMVGHRMAVFPYMRARM